MDIFFILLGLAIFFAASAVFAIDHYRVNPPQALVAFLVPPFAWWLYHHFWQGSKNIFYTQVVACLLVVVGILMMTSMDRPYNEVLTSTQHSDPLNVKQVNSNHVNSSDVNSNKVLKDLSEAEKFSQSLNGRLEGESFLFDESSNSVDTAEFDRSGTLRIKQGAGFFGRFEIAIEFNEYPAIGDSWTRIVQAQGNNNNQVLSPRIYVSWYDSDQKQMQSRKYESGYDLSFILTHEEYNKFQSKIRLVLPDVKQSFLVGEFFSYNSSLRFSNDGLIHSHDSIETLEMVAVQDIMSAFRENITQIIGFEGTDFNYLNARDDAFSTVYIKDKEGLIRKIALSFNRKAGDWSLIIKGLDKQFSSLNNIVKWLPKSLNPAMQVDESTIGLIQALPSVELNSLSANSSQFLAGNEKPSLTSQDVEKASSQVSDKPLESIETHVEAAHVEAAQVEIKAAPADTKESISNESSVDSNVDSNVDTKTISTQGVDEQDANTQSAEQSENQTQKTLKIHSNMSDSELKQILLPLMNQDVELNTTAGKFKTGMYVGVYRQQIILEAELGGGIVEFLTETLNIKSLRMLKPSDTLPRIIEFHHP